MVCDHVQIIHKGQLVFNGAIEVLKQQRQGNKLLLGLNNAPSLDEIENISGVVSVNAAHDGLLRVQYAVGENPAERIVELAVNKKWGLHQITPDQTSLEEVFVQLTYQEAAN